MLRLKQIKKDYIVGDMRVEALKGIDLCFRKNEFVSILGPSGCGKTTLLNIIGGLDKYTSGDLTINGRSTKEYKDRDWDVYRNHRIGFIFQSYNLIPHQTILGNVELALTISGMSKQERIEKAKRALDRVGLKGQYNKKPNQLSGGQCQRVAIARALVNEPEILLADEPTGALDTVTSVQIMELIKEIAHEKLVIMVTHNPDLAYKYSSRIVKLLDGNVVEDSNPFSSEDEQKENNQNKDNFNEGKEKAKMSLWTSFKLSFKNLFSKRARTILTCFAGSIGIIGVSMVLAVSSGVKGYINSMQDDMLSGNPIRIDETTYDIEAFLGQMSTGEKLELIKDNEIRVDSLLAFFAEKFTGDNSFIVNNTITREYVNYIKAMPKEYSNAIAYYYGVNLNNNIYTTFKPNNSASEERVSLTALKTMYTKTLETSEYSNVSFLVNQVSILSQSIPNEEYIASQYELLGDSKIATKADEIMIVLGKDQEINDLTLALLGYYNQDEFINLAQGLTDKKTTFTFEEILGKDLIYYPNDSIYTENTNPITSANAPFIYNAYADGIDENEGMKLKVVGILKPKDDISYGALTSGVYYTPQLVDYHRASALKSKLYDYSKDKVDENGDFVFGVSDGAMTNIKDAIFYNYHYYKYDGTKVDNQSTILTSSNSSIMFNLGSMTGTTDLGPSLRELGICDIPNSIAIYPLSFEEKFLVTDYLDKWNEDTDLTFTYFDEDTNQDITVTVLKEDRNNIEYTDMLELIITMINSMIDIVTYALIAFTALSLVVSCVMIAIITYVSVMERIKEIGVIRSLGGRKKDVSHLFNAETFIIGGAAGIVGILVTYLLSLIVNLIVGSLTGIYTIASLPWYQAIIMILVSIILTCISGLIPARSAAKKDPVVALRTE